MTDKACTLVRICPFTRTVETVEWSGIGRDLNKLLAPPPPPDEDALPYTPQSGLFCFAHCGAVSLVVDDEGLYHGWPAFQFVGYPQALSGRALVTSTDGEGNTLPALDVETVRRMVFWDATPAKPSFQILTGDDALKAMGW